MKWHRRLIYLALTILFHLQFRFKCAYATLLNPTSHTVHKAAYFSINASCHIENLHAVIFSWRCYTAELFVIWTEHVQKEGGDFLLISCLLTLYPGLCQEGVYQRPGNPGRVSHLLEEFTHDARNVKLREKEHQLQDVTDTLKSFLSQAEDALLTKELYPYWVSALGV